MSRVPTARVHAAQEQGVEALLHVAKDSVAVRKTIVNHPGVHSHLVKISEQLHECRTQSADHAPSSDSTAVPPGLWRHDLGGSPGTEDHAQAFLCAAEIDATAFPQLAARPNYPPSQLAIEKPNVGTDENHTFFSTEPPAAGQSDALLGNLVVKARGQQDIQELLHEGCATYEIACEPEEETDVEDLVDAQSTEHPQQHKSKRKKQKEEVEEPPRASDTALIVKGINSMCQRVDVYAMLEASGFTGTFDLLYLPINFVNHQNRGYFHINFKDAAGAKKFVQMVHGEPSSSAMNRAIGKSGSRLVTYRARYQGLRSFAMDMLSGRKLRSYNEDYRPWVYLSGLNGRPLTKEMAEGLVSTEIASSGGAQSFYSNVTLQ